MAIAIFFVVHSTLSVFTQTFFLHRYGAHRMFKMSRGWERFFYLLTYLTQGSSFLVPKAYAVLHRMQHAYSDTPKDPHSPRNYSGLGPMMMDTKNGYHDLAYGLATPEPRFDGGYPEWKAIDRLGQSPPQVRTEPELRGAVVRDRSCLSGDAGARVAEDHRLRRASPGRAVRTGRRRRVSVQVA
ncbi:MAG: hypothetical protein ABI134_26870 [Byssovorax sp.]